MRAWHWWSRRLMSWPRAWLGFGAARRAVVADRSRDVPVSTVEAREIARLFRVPDVVVGLPTPRWRRWWQRHVTRRP